MSSVGLGVRSESRAMASTAVNEFLARIHPYRLDDKAGDAAIDQAAAGRGHCRVVLTT